MAFADLKNDFVFRRIFATHPDILRSLLNDLLERSGDRAIDTIEYLPGEQLPLVIGAKLATFTQEELDAYQKVTDEIQQVRELAEAKLAEGEARGRAEGEARGRSEGKRVGLLAVLAARGIAVTEEARARVEACVDESALDRWMAAATSARSLEDVFTPPANST
ncbi:MAG: hypothetical protein R3F14_16060 [Polyangiaceae bacterium]